MVDDKQLDILVVEDTEKHQRSATELLSGHNVTILPTYSDAIEVLLCTDRYDVLLTDLFLPRGEFLPRREWEKLYELSPIGYFLAQLAVTRGIKHVGIVADTKQRDGVLTATIEDFGKFGDGTFGYSPNYSRNFPLIRGNQELWLFDANHYPYLITTATGEDCKNWKAALEVMLGTRRPFTYADDVMYITARSRRTGTEEIVALEKRFTDEIWK